MRNFNKEPLETTMFKGIEVPKKYLKDAEDLYQEAFAAGPKADNPFVTPSRRRTWRVRVWEKAAAEAEQLH